MSEREVCEASAWSPRLD